MRDRELDQGKFRGTCRICRGYKNRLSQQAEPASAESSPPSVPNAPMRNISSTSSAAGVSKEDSVPTVSFPHALRGMNAALVPLVLPFIGDAGTLLSFGVCAQGIKPTEPNPTDAELAGAEFYDKGELLDSSRDFITAVHQHFARLRDPWPHCEALLLDALQASPLNLEAVNDVRMIRLVAEIGPAWLKKTPEQRARWLASKLEQHGDQLLGASSQVQQQQQSAGAETLLLDAPVRTATDASHEEAALYLSAQQQASPLRFTTAAEEVGVPSIRERAELAATRSAAASSSQAEKVSPSRPSEVGTVANLHERQVAARSDRARLALRESAEAEVNPTDITETMPPAVPTEKNVPDASSCLGQGQQSKSGPSLPHSSSAASEEQDERATASPQPIATTTPQRKRSSPGTDCEGPTKKARTAADAVGNSLPHPQLALQQQSTQLRPGRVDDCGSELSNTDGIVGSDLQLTQLAQSQPGSVDDELSITVEADLAEAAPLDQLRPGAQQQQQEYGTIEPSPSTQQSSPCSEQASAVDGGAGEKRQREFAVPEVSGDFKRWLDRKQYPDAAHYVVQESKKVLPKAAVRILEKHHVFTESISVSAINGINRQDSSTVCPEQFAKLVNEHLLALKTDYAGREDLW